MSEGFGTIGCAGCGLGPSAHGPDCILRKNRLFLHHVHAGVDQVNTPRPEPGTSEDGTWTVERMTKRASVLFMQCKKHQVFREHLAESLKMAEAGHLYLQIAEAVKSDEEAYQFNLKQAATCLSRAKRLARDLSRAGRKD